MVKIVLMEAKTDKTIGDNAVAQIISYFLASSANYLGQPPIGIIILQQMARLFFFSAERISQVLLLLQIQSQWARVQKRCTKCSEVGRTDRGITEVL